MTWILANRWHYGLAPSVEKKSKSFQKFTEYSAISSHFLFRDGNNQSSVCLLAEVQTVSHQAVSLVTTKSIWARWGGRKGERRMEGKKKGGGIGRGSRRQMPPQWPWHCRILIVWSHIVPSSLEMWELPCCVPPSHANIKMKRAEVKNQI